VALLFAVSSTFWLLQCCDGLGGERCLGHLAPGHYVSRVKWSELILGQRLAGRRKTKEDTNVVRAISRKKGRISLALDGDDQPSRLNEHLHCCVGSCFLFEVTRCVRKKWVVALREAFVELKKLHSEPVAGQLGKTAATSGQTRPGRRRNRCGRARYGRDRATISLDQTALLYYTIVLILLQREYEARSYRAGLPFA
jgi:hypothetical protein